MVKTEDEMNEFNKNLREQKESKFSNADLLVIGFVIGMGVIAILSTLVIVNPSSVSYKAGYTIGINESMNNCFTGCNVADKLVNELNISSVLKDDFDKDMEFLITCIKRCKE